MATSIQTIVNNLSKNAVLIDTEQSITGKKIFSAIEVPTKDISDSSDNAASTQFVANKVSDLVASAPEALDTLKELADALGNDPNFAATITNKLAELKTDLTSVSSSKWVKRVAGNPPTNQSEIDNLTSDMPVNSLIVFEGA